MSYSCGLGARITAYLLNGVPHVRKNTCQVSRTQRTGDADYVHEIKDSRRSRNSMAVIAYLFSPLLTQKGRFFSKRFSRSWLRSTFVNRCWNFNIDSLSTREDIQNERKED